MLTVRGKRLTEADVRDEIRRSLRVGRMTELLGVQVLAIGEWRIQLRASDLADHEKADALSAYCVRALRDWPKLTGSRPLSCLSNRANWAVLTMLRHRDRYTERLEEYRKLHSTAE